MDQAWGKRTGALPLPSSDTVFYFQRQDIAELSSMITMHFLFNFVICWQKRMKGENLNPHVDLIPRESFSSL